MRLGRVLGPVIAGLGLIAVFLFLFFDLPAVASVIERVNLVWYSLAFLAVTLGVTFYALAWRSLLHYAAIRLSFTRTLSLTWTSIFFNLVVPTASISGEVARVYLASKDAGCNSGDVAATILGHRVITLIPFIAGSVLGVLNLAMAYTYPAWVIGTVIIVVGVLTVAFLAACFLSLRPEALESVVRWAVKQGSRLRMRHAGRSHDSGLSGLMGQLASLRTELLHLWASPLHLVKPLAYSLLFWLSDVSVAYLVFLALGVAVPFDLIAVVYTIGITMQMVPLGIPGNVGPVELVMTTLYSLAGVNPSVSAAATILIRLAMMWFEVAVGGIVTYLSASRLRD
ncbi:MAG: flippase-like domain-containing protein [Candidatus Bathyarchaeia archaeon]